MGRSPLYGTHRTTRPDGYIRVWRPGHPIANGDGYVLEHRLVLYEAGVELPKGAHVHHRNGDKGDNRLENLEVVTVSTHVHHHIAERGGVVVNQYGTYSLVTEKSCETCGDPFRPWKPTSRFCSRVCANRRPRTAVAAMLLACALLVMASTYGSGERVAGWSWNDTDGWSWNDPDAAEWT